MKNKNLSKIITVSILSITLFAFAYAVNSYTKSQHANFIEREHRQFDSDVNDISFHLSKAQSAFHALSGFLLSNNLDDNFNEKLDVFIESNKSNYSMASGILIAPKGKINYTYPKESFSEAMIESRKTEFETRLHYGTVFNKITFRGPFDFPGNRSNELVLQKFIVDKNNFWGIINVFIPFENLIEPIMLNGDGNLKYSIKNNSNKVIYGDESVFKEPVFTASIEMSDGNWEIAALIKSKEPFYSSIIDFVIFGIFLVAISAILTYLFISRNKRLTDLVDLRTVELKDSMQIFNAFMEHIPVPIAIGKTSEELVYANKNDIKLQKYLPPGEMMESIYEKNHIKYEETFESDGKESSFMTHTFLIEQVSEPLVASVRFDISELKNTSKMLSELLKENEEIYFETIKSLANAIDAKDPYTSGHCRRVSEYAILTGMEMNLKPAELKDLNYAANIHDIGKIGIAGRILNKPGSLTEDEYEQLKKHPSIGHEIIKDVCFLKRASKIILQHHERYDGKGYPYGLEAENIDPLARILFVSDAYDAMTSKRTYRKRALTESEALKELIRNKGTQFDSAAVDAFVNAVKKRKSVKQDILLS